MNLSEKYSVRFLMNAFILLGLIIAAAIITLMFPGKEYALATVVDFVTDWPLNIGVGVTFLFITSYFVAPGLQNAIVQQNMNASFVAICFSFLVLLIGTLMGSMVGFIEEGYPNSPDDIGEAAFDYLVKPTANIFFFGFLPTLGMGAILGLIIKETHTSDTSS